MLGLLALLPGCARVGPATPQADPAPAPAGPLKVLFIGNSYTTYNDLPGMVAAMSRQLPDGPAIDTGMVAQGMASLASLWAAGGAFDRIWRGDWDVVVLQESSGIPASAPADFIASVRKFDPLVRGRGGQSLLFMTWAHADRPAMYVDNLAAFDAAADSLGIPYAPVGTAWQLALEAAPDLPLYQADNTHPTAMGSWLAACVFVQYLRHQALACPDLDTVDLPPAARQILQQAASQAVMLGSDYRP